MDKQFEQAVEIGQQNANIISLGKAWCTHLRADRTGWGVGMIEEATGLPVTGGRLTCDFARRPSGVSGMQLEVTALGFYEDNCRGCTDRAPGNRVPNLSTWAEPLIAERVEWERAQEAAHRAALAERKQRADHRTLVTAALPATAQEIVALINRIDLDPSDTDARETLRSQASLAADTFAGEVIDMLYTDAALLRSALFLEVLLSVDRPGNAQLHDLCLRAVRDGWGLAEGCRYLSEHGLVSDIDEDLLNATVAHAAPTDTMMMSTPGYPAALRHYHSLAPNTVERRVKNLLGHGDGRRRAQAAAAAKALVASEAACGERLLAALLDGLRHHEDIYDEHGAGNAIASVIAAVVLKAPEVVAAAVEQRWNRASPEYRSRFIDCYLAVLRRGLTQLPDEVGRTAIARAVTALTEPLNWSEEGPIEDYQGKASDLLKGAVRASSTGVAAQDVLIGLLLDWLERDRGLDGTEVTDDLEALEHMSAQGRIRHVTRSLSSAVVLSGQRDPAAFIDLCYELYAGTETAAHARAEVVRCAGRVAARSGAVDQALALIYTAMLGDDQSVRSAGLEAADRVLQELPQESVPPLLAQAVVAGLTDQYLIVVMAAIKAARRVPADVINHRAATVAILTTARAYASDRTRDRLVQDALSAAHHLVTGDAQWLDVAQTAALEIVKLMPAYEARETLRWSQWLESHDNWPDAAIHSLRVDENPQYEHLGDENKEALLDKLGRRRLTSHQIDTLAIGELEAVKSDWQRSLLAADLFSEHGRPDLSVGMIGAHLEGVPDTIERRARRQSIERVLLAYRFEEAIASQRPSARRAVLERIEALCAN